jgi:hypothetical protein
MAAPFLLMGSGSAGSPRLNGFIKHGMAETRSVFSVLAQEVPSRRRQGELLFLAASGEECYAGKYFALHLSDIEITNLATSAT